MICCDECLVRFIENLLALSGLKDSHNKWLRFWGAGQGLTEVTIYDSSLNISSANCTNAAGATLSATGASTLSLSCGFTNSAGATISVNAATLNLGAAGTSWTNNGTISATNNSSVNLYGNLTDANFTGYQPDATTDTGIYGTLANSTLTLANIPGSIYLAPGGAINGGIVQQSTGHPLNVNGGTLNGVTVNGGALYAAGTLIGVTINGGDLNDVGTIEIVNGITVTDENLNLLSSGTTLYFDGPSQTLDNINIKASNSTEISLGGDTESTVPISVTLGKNATIFGGVDIEDNRISGNTLINDGTINGNTGFSDTIGVSNFTNNGLVEATNGGTVVFSSNNVTLVNQGTLAVHNGTIRSANGLMVGEGTLTGSGTIVGNVTLASDPSTLAFNLGGVSRGTQYDSITINGNIAVAGNLELTLTNGFIPLATNSFTVLTSTAMTGSFLDVASGGRLETTDGHGSFQVNYGGTGQYADEILLENFQVTVPEPASFSLLTLATTALLFRRRVRPSIPLPH